jgi:hypothetical protein
LSEPNGKAGFSARGDRAQTVEDGCFQELFLSFGRLLPRRLAESGAVLLSEDEKSSDRARKHKR